MKKYNCYILDDEPLAIKVIEQHLSKFPQLDICGKSTEPMKAYAQLKTLQPDLLFLDIEMPEITGLELLETLNLKPEIIITTAYREFAVEGFDLNVLDYLVKPIPFKRFVKAIDKFLNSKAPVNAALEEDALRFIFVKAERKNIKIFLEEILYIEGLKDYVKIVLANKNVLTKQSIGNFLKELPNNQFMRIHKSFIVNKSKITAFTKHDVEIGDLEIPIGRVYKEEFLKNI